MFRINLIKRLPKKPLLALAVLALALAAGAGAMAKPADAQAQKFTIEVRINSVKFDKISDNIDDTRAELYGDVKAFTNTGSARDGRKLGETFDFFSGCHRPWVTTAVNGDCARRVDQGVTNFFHQTPLCAEDTQANTCRLAYALSNNTMRIGVSVGEAINTSTKLIDADYSSNDDGICSVSSSTGALSLSQLQGLSTPFTFTVTQPFNGHGACTMSFTIHRV